MGSQLAIWLPAVIVAHVLGAILLLYSLEKVSGAVSKNWRRARALLRNRSRVDDGAETPHWSQDAEVTGVPPPRPKVHASKWRRGDCLVRMAPSASSSGQWLGRARGPAAGPESGLDLLLATGPAEPGRALPGRQSPAAGEQQTRTDGPSYTPRVLLPPPGPGSSAPWGLPATRSARCAWARTARASAGCASTRPRWPPAVRAWLCSTRRTWHGRASPATCWTSARSR